MAMAMESVSARTIDDFLDQLYQECKGRLPRASLLKTEYPPPNIRRGHSICQYRHYLPLPLLALCVANSSDATEILMLSYLLANSTFRREMLSDDGNGADSSSTEGAEYLAASIFLGMLLGGTLLGFLSDHIGRRPALLAGLSLNATAGFFSSFPLLTPTIGKLTMWRFVAGIGIGATVPSLFSLASEWSPKEVRGSVVTFAASFWMVGSLFVSGLAWILFRGNIEHDFQDQTLPLPMWRIFAALCALPSALGALMVYSYVPESPRFLASSKQKYAMSAHVCNQMAECLGVKLTDDANDETSAGGEEGEQSQMKDGLIKERGGTNSVNSANSVSMHVIKPLTEDELRRDYASSIAIDTTGTSSTFAERLLRTLRTLFETLRKLFSPHLLTRTTLPLQTLWFALSFGTYGITTWINTLFVTIHLQNIYFNSFLFALANLPGNLVSIIYSDRWGRKRMLIGSLVGAALGLGIFAMLVYYDDKENDNDKEHDSSSRSSARTYGIVLSACTFQMFSIVSWNTIDILTGELFPTRVRSAGMGVCTACGRFGAMFAQLVNARLMMDADGEGAVSSASVLIVAASTLLLGAGMPYFLDSDMALGELKDDVTDEHSTRQITLGCVARFKGKKDHMSDDEGDFALNGRSRNEYQSFQEMEAYLL